MTINWKQGLFAAALLLSVSLLFVGCSKNKTDKAVADKSTGEIIGEEIDVIEVVPAQTPNVKSNGTEQSAPAAPVQPANSAPAMTPPTTTPTENAPAPTPDQTPESATTPDAAPSSTTSSVTVSTTCSESTSELDFSDSMESDSVIESESTCCCIRRTICSSSCAPCAEACQSACQAAPACAPDPVCAPEPTCAPAPACAPVCEPLCAPCRPQRMRFNCRPCGACCRTELRCQRTCSACSAACEPACAPACVSACSSANTMRSDNWSNEQGAPNDSARNSTLPELGNNYSKTTELTDTKTSVPAQKAKPSTAVGSDSTSPEAPSIVLPEAK
ncbi:MAG: hypothetical protein IKX40_10055 [Thermoguttaceae bacterium]|nr:hypothetical protein [Thermoguttaceae bacterium]